MAASALSPCTAASTLLPMLLLLGWASASPRSDQAASSCGLAADVKGAAGEAASLLQLGKPRAAGSREARPAASAAAAPRGAGEAEVAAAQAAAVPLGAGEAAAGAPPAAEAHGTTGSGAGGGGGAAAEGTFAEPPALVSRFVTLQVRAASALLERLAAAALGGKTAAGATAAAGATVGAAAASAGASASLAPRGMDHVPLLVVMVCIGVAAFAFIVCSYELCLSGRRSQHAERFNAATQNFQQSFQEPLRPPAPRPPTRTRSTCC